MTKAKLTDRATQVRFFRFVMVGGVVAVVQFAVIAAVQNYWTPNVAFTGGFTVATLTHYLLNRFWALPSKRGDAGRQFGEYLLTVAVSYLINIGGFNFSRAVLGLSVMWSAACAVPPATLVVFLLLNYRVFSARSC